MSKEPVTRKWQRVTTVQKPRKRCEGWVPAGQLYAEIAEGYQYYLSSRIRTETLKHRRRSK